MRQYFCLMALTRGGVPYRYAPHGPSSCAVQGRPRAIELAFLYQGLAAHSTQATITLGAALNSKSFVKRHPELTPWRHEELTRGEADDTDQDANGAGVG